MDLGLNLHIIIAAGYILAEEIARQLDENNITNYFYFDQTIIRKNGRLVSYSNYEEMTDVILFHVLKDEEIIFI